MSGLDRVTQHAYLLYFHLYDVARFHEHFRIAPEANAGRRAGGDYVAGQETVELRVVLDELHDAEYQVVGVRVLHYVAVQPRLDLHVRRVRDLVLRRDAGTHRTEGREHLAEQVVLPGVDRAHDALRLEDWRDPVARRDVVDERVAEDVIECLRRLH